VLGSEMGVMVSTQIGRSKLIRNADPPPVLTTRVAALDI
jgi:hypothetical protein